MTYAIKTKVSVEKTIGEIRKILNKAGADGFAFAENGTMAFVAFRFKARAIKIFIHLPELNSDSSSAT